MSGSSTRGKESKSRESIPSVETCNPAQQGKVPNTCGMGLLQYLRLYVQNCRGWDSEVGGLMPNSNTNDGDTPLRTRILDLYMYTFLQHYSR